MSTLFSFTSYANPGGFSDDEQVELSPQKSPSHQHADNGCVCEIANQTLQQSQAEFTAALTMAVTATIICLAAVTPKDKIYSLKSVLYLKYNVLRAYLTPHRAPVLTE